MEEIIKALDVLIATERSLSETEAFEDEGYIINREAVVAAIVRAASERATLLSLIRYRMEI